MPDPGKFVNISPKTADWLISNPDNAAIAHDDAADARVGLAQADRLPGEFYQLDLEMSFVEQDDVQALDRDARTLRTLLSARHPQEVN